MRLNIFKHCLVVGTLLLLASSGCDLKDQPVEVKAPTIPTDTESLDVYKRSLFSRPIVMGFFQEWGATNGVMLATTPDSLDVAVVEPLHSEITPAMAKDLQTVQTEKRTTVLLRGDLQAISNRYGKKLKKESAARRKALVKSWDPEQMPSAEEQATRLAALEAEVTKTIREEAAAEAAQAVNTLLQNGKEFGFNGVSVYLPDNFTVFTEEVLISLLSKVGTECGKGKTMHLAIENPFEEARTQIEQATWVVYNEQTPDKYLQDFTKEAYIWSNCRYLPSVDLSADSDVKGFLDSSVFNPAGKTPASIEVINWDAPNRAGVAYYDAESDANFDTTSKRAYPQLRVLINMVGWTK